MDIVDFSPRKMTLALIAVAGLIFAFGGLARDYRELPDKVTSNTTAIRANTEAIQSTNGKLDSVLCLLVQDQITPEEEVLNPLLCLDPERVDLGPFLRGGGSAGNE